MSDNNALADKLATLAADDEVYVDGARIISRGGQPPALTAILREIDNTVLERKLMLAIGDVQVSMVVAGCRLQGLTDISTDITGKDAVVGQVLSRDDADSLAAVADVMIRLCENDPKVTVRSAQAERMGNQSEAGVSVRALTEAWNVDLAAKVAPPMERFLTKNADAITAYIQISDSAVTDTKGDVAALQTIWDTQASAFRKNHTALYPQQKAPILVCIEDAIAGQTPVAIARTENETCVFTYTSENIGQILKSWHAITS